MIPFLYQLWTYFLVLPINTSPSRIRSTIARLSRSHTIKSTYRSIGLSSLSKFHPSLTLGSSFCHNRTLQRNLQNCYDHFVEKSWKISGYDISQEGRSQRSTWSWKRINYNSSRVKIDYSIEYDSLFVDVLKFDNYGHNHKTRSHGLTIISTIVIRDIEKISASYGDISLSIGRSINLNSRYNTIRTYAKKDQSLWWIFGRGDFLHFHWIFISTRTIPFD